MTHERTGILLLNLGTPDAPTVPAVRRFLREFLSDPLVITLPAPIRWLLLNAVILPFRSKISTEAYQQIWTEQGSPLLVYSKQLHEKLQQQLGEKFTLALAMRYGNPTIKNAIKALLTDNCQKIIVVPLYPQYAASTTQSSILETKKILKQLKTNIPVTFLDAFYKHPEYIQSSSEIIADTLKNKAFDKLIFSYHGLPENHIHKVCQEKQSCDLKAPCPAIANNNAQCYRAQCYATSHAIAKTLDLPEDKYIVTFQSRLGKTPWITPYTDVLLTQLAAQGIKNIAIACPSFIVDCLETLEEINIRARAQWQSLGGDQFTLTPCLNAHPSWVNALTNIIHSKNATIHSTYQTTETSS